MTRRDIRRIKKERKQMSMLLVGLSILVLMFIGVTIRLCDELDYYKHELYAVENNCEWEWTDLGEWTICR